MASPFAPLFAAPQSRWFKIGACDWSLGKRCDPAAFDVAKQIGLDGVQVEHGHVANDMHLRRPEVQKAYLDAAKRTGLEIASLAIGEMNNVPLKSDPRAAEWLADSIDVCKALGLTIVHARLLRQRRSRHEQRPPRSTTWSACSRTSAAKAEKQGVAIGLENYLSAEDNMRIIDRVGSPAVKVYYDVGNSTDKGRDIFKEIRTLGADLRVPRQGRPPHAGPGPHRLQAGPQGPGRHPVQRLDPDRGRQPHGLIPDYTAHCKYLKRLFPRTVAAQDVNDRQ